MCGFLGIYQKSNFDFEYQKFKSSLELLDHRGPDDYGIETFSSDKGLLALGHKRLSIIDLSSAGHQPMISKDRRYSIVFNGELYNYIELREELIIKGYIFNTNSDTEVLLNAWIEWGHKGLIKLNGMFAFVVYDQIKNTLTLVRDAFGIKPLYYYVDNERFIFSSEIDPIKKLLPRGAKQNFQIAYDYLLWSKIDNSKNTFYDEIYKLKPSSYLVINLEEISKSFKSIEQKYWWWPSIKERKISFKDAKNKVRDIFLKNGIEKGLRGRMIQMVYLEPKWLR